MNKSLHFILHLKCLTSTDANCVTHFHSIFINKINCAWWVMPTHWPNAGKAIFVPISCVWWLKCVLFNSALQRILYDFEAKLFIKNLYQIAYTELCCDNNNGMIHICQISYAFCSVVFHKPINKWAGFFSLGQHVLQHSWWGNAEHKKTQYVCM